MNERAELIDLAKAIQRRMRDFEEAHGYAFKIGHNLSRLLENDPDYRPYRRRDPAKQRGPAIAPGLFMVKRIAEQLDTTVGELLGERGFDLTVSDRRRIRELLDFLHQRLALDDVAPPPLPFRFPVPEGRFQPRDYDYPQALHARIVPATAVAAGSGGIEADHALMATPDLRDGALQVMKVIGDSMAELLRDGYRILVDTRLKNPKNGDPVAVYIKDEGGVIGYWREESRGQVFLDKHNSDYEPVKLGHSFEWFVVGTLIKIVEAPLFSRQQ